MYRKGYALIHCGGHVIAQIDLKEFPCEIVSRKRKKCPECGSPVDEIGCKVHGKLDWDLPSPDGVSYPTRGTY